MRLQRNLNTEFECTTIKACDRSKACYQFLSDCDTNEIVRTECHMERPLNVFLHQKERIQVLTVNHQLKLTLHKQWVMYGLESLRPTCFVRSALPHEDTRESVNSPSPTSLSTPHAKKVYHRSHNYKAIIVLIQ